MVSNDEAGSKPLERPCKKCNKQEATHTSRTEPVCTDCFTQYIYSKCVRQIGIVGKETQPPQGAPPLISRRYILGLSLGTSSTVLLHIVNGYISAILSKGRRSPFDLDVICIDTSISDSSPNPVLQDTLATYRQRYPGLKIDSIPLTSVLGIPTIDWSSLPQLNTALTPAGQLNDLFSRLPSATSRADILRLFIRHLLIHTALTRNAQAVLFGHSTTTLGALTLSETAKGRGFSLPWQINDGLLPVQDFSSSPSSSSAKIIRIHHPLRELYRKELDTYATLTTPRPLTEIIPPPEVVEAAAAVVSHRDLSIDEVMSRYFADVEENYPSIVANVVRTTAKLDRVEAEGRCGVCGMSLDEDGDERWKGEIGDVEEEGREGRRGRLCYGCERSVHG